MFGQGERWRALLFHAEYTAKVGFQLLLV